MISFEYDFLKCYGVITPDVRTDKLNVFLRFLSDVFFHKCDFSTSDHDS